MKKNILDFTEWELETWIGVIIIIFVIYASIASIIDSMQNHELALAKVRCENTQTMGLKQ